MNIRNNEIYSLHVSKKGYLKELEKGIRIWKIRVAVVCPNTGNSYYREEVFAKKEKCEVSPRHQKLNI